MQKKIKVFIPSYSRADTITTHKLFLDYLDTFELKIVVRYEQLDEYIYETGLNESFFLYGDFKNLAETRQFIYDQQEQDEWFISIDDDIKNIYINKQSWDKEISDDYKYEPDFEFFVSKIPELIEKANSEKVYTIGIATVRNEFFNTIKYRQVGHIAHGLVFFKKENNISWIRDGFGDAMEEMNITAQQHMYYGKVLRVGYIATDAKMYAKGGIGEYASRLPRKIEECKKLMKYYGSIFRPKSDSDISIAFTNLKQVKLWRLKMIYHKKLPKEFAYSILSKKEAEQFISKYNL